MIGLKELVEQVQAVDGRSTVQVVDVTSFQWLAKDGWSKDEHPCEISRSEDNVKETFNFTELSFHQFCNLITGGLHSLIKKSSQELSNTVMTEWVPMVSDKKSKVVLRLLGNLIVSIHAPESETSTMSKILDSFQLSELTNFPDLKIEGQFAANEWPDQYVYNVTFGSEGQFAVAGDDYELVLVITHSDKNVCKTQIDVAIRRNLGAEQDGLQMFFIREDGKPFFLSQIESSQDIVDKILVFAKNLYDKVTGYRRTLETNSDTTLDDAAIRYWAERFELDRDCSAGFGQKIKDRVLVNRPTTLLDLQVMVADQASQEDSSASWAKHCTYGAIIGGMTLS